MAYGHTCCICGGIVDNNEFNFAKEMCKECASAKEQEIIRQSEATRLMNSECEQMRLEDICVLN